MRLVALLTIVLAAGCAVHKAANKKGVEPDRVAECITLTCLQSMETAELVERRELENGETVYFYRMLRRQGSTARAVFHAGADVFTLGLWEVVATPAEGAIQNNEHFVVEATCNAENQCRDLKFHELRGRAPETNGAPLSETPSEGAAPATGE